mgnify:CR=1 FL=1
MAAGDLELIGPRLRARWNSRTFWIAITAWSANVRSRVRLLVGETAAPKRLATPMDADGRSAAEHRHGEEGSR